MVSFELTETLFFAACWTSKNQNQVVSSFSPEEHPMINPLKFAEMLSKANEVQEEVHRKLGETMARLPPP